MSNRHDLTRSIERARKALAYSIAQKADAKGARQERRAARMERVERKRYLEACRWSPDMGEA